MKGHRFAALSCVATLVLACDSTSPAPNLDGVWGGLIQVTASTDTLTLALGEQEGQIRGFGFQHPRDDSRYPRIYSVLGSITGQSVELSLNQGFGALLMRGELNGSTLTMSSVGSEPVSLRLFTSRGDGVTGTWGLVSTTGPTLAIRDTIVLLPDGRARRHREEEFSGYGTLAIWSRRGTRLVLEQYAPSSSNIPFLDSLQIQPNSLVRTTRLGDSTVIETYGRAP